MERNTNNKKNYRALKVEKGRRYKRRTTELIRGLSSEYQSVYLIDLEENFMEVIYRMCEKKRKLYVTLSHSVGVFTDAMMNYNENVVKEEDRKEFAKLYDADYIKANIIDEYSCIDVNYIQLTDETHFFQAKIFSVEKTFPVRRVIMGIRCVDDIVEWKQSYQKRLEEANAALRLALTQEEQYKKTLQEHMEIIQMLSKDYTSIYLVNLENGSVIPYRLSERNEREYGEAFSHNIVWDDLLLDYTDKYVEAEYKDKLRNVGLTACMKELLQSRETIEVEYKNEREDENHFYLMKVVRMSDINCKNVVVGFADVNEERKRELEIQKAMKLAYDAANAASRAKTDFLSKMSHDIRTPMNAIIGMTSIAGLHLDDKEKVEDCLQKIMVSSTHLLSLINEVLDMSKIESGKIELVEEEFHLVELMDNLLTMVRLPLKRKNHNLRINSSKVEHEKVMGDSVRIQQAFMNLLTNAIKYTPENGNIQISITEKTTRQSNVGCYEFVFEDDGIGMDKEFMKVIYEPFSRANDSRIDKIQGTGLGMAITRNIIRMMGGDIKIESEVGKGSKFIVTIFLKIQEQGTVNTEDFCDLPVLIVDDEKSSCEDIYTMLDDLGMKAECVASGEEAACRIEKAHETGKDFFAVLVDWKMSQMDGAATTRLIREKAGSEIPVIIISSCEWSEIEEEAREAGATMFVNKPVFKSKLVHLFKKLMGKEDEEEKNILLKQIREVKFSDMRVLLVEDNDLNAEIAQELIGMMDVKVECVENGQKAVDRLSEVEDGYYNMVFMDIQMPIMNGYEATKRIRKSDREYLRNIPIIAMTANAFTEDVQAALQAGMNEHISKPIDLAALEKVLTKWG